MIKKGKLSGNSFNIIHAALPPAKSSHRLDMVASSLLSPGLMTDGRKNAPDKQVSRQGRTQSTVTTLVFCSVT